MSIETLIFNRFIRQKNTGYTRPVVRIATIGVILSCVVMIFSVCISFGFKNEVSRQVFGVSGHLHIAPYQTTAQLPNPISRDSIDWEAINAFVATSSSWQYHKQAFATQIGLIKTDLYNHGIWLKGVNSEFDFSFLKSCLIEGKIPQLPDSSISNDVLISLTLAKKLHLNVGDKVRTYFVYQNDVKARAFNICGVFESGFSTFDETMMIGDLRHIQRLNGWNIDEVSGFEIILPQPSVRELPQYAKIFNGFLPLDLVAIPITFKFPEIFNWLDLMDMNVVVILVIMALVIAISLISVFVVMIIEKTGEIGLFKTLGMSLAAIRRIFVWKVMYIAGKGLLIGNFIGLTLCLVQKYYPIFKLDASVYYIKHVPIQFEWSWLILCNIGTLVIILLAVLLPSMAIGKIKEAEAVKFE
ncbi:MAG: ABC transporter permease [Bacteroidales bacterium]|jgi:lipoprotein-releasing system permease protein|nr:ABC transporter permease [Bacteroidales bacterium]